MFVTRRFGHTIASIRVRPLTILGWSSLLVVFGLMFIVRALQVLFLDAPPPHANPLAGIAVGFMLLIVGYIFINAALRHLMRAVRTFLS
jgi:hypothetical protein